MAETANNKSDKLKKACDQAYALYPHSCSHAVWHVIKQYIPEQPYLTANALINHLTASPDWQEVHLAELSKLASEGVPVVGGAVDVPNGHIIAVYPGPEKFDGGFPYTSKEGKRKIARKHGSYPLAMSTSMGSWPGASSKGEKTVRDPWPPKKFPKVKFWKYIGK